MQDNPPNVANAPNATDTIPPAAAFTSPSNGSTVSGKVSISAKAQDNVAVAQMKPYIDGQQASSNSDSATLTYTGNTKPVRQWTHG